MGNKAYGHLDAILKNLQLRGLPGDMETPALLRAVLTGLHETVVVVLDKTGTYLFAWAPPEFCERYGVEASSLIGQDLYSVYPPEEAKERMEGLAGIIATGQPRREEFCLALPGGLFWHDIALAPMLDENGKAHAVLGVLRDIGESKRAAEAQEKLEERIRQAQKLESLANLARGVAHDFNNLLLGVLGNASLLLDELPSDSTARLRLRQIEKSALGAADLTRQLLAYSGGGQMLLGRVELNELVKETADLLRVSIPDRVTLDFELSELTPMQADSTQLRQVIMNLLLNAAEAIGEKTGRVQIKTERIEVDKGMLVETYLADEMPDGPYQCLEIRDNGKGMTPEVVQKVFEPFFSTKFVGRGLGLAAVLGIVKAHHGALQIDSHAGEGSVFRVYLPEHRKK